MPPPFSVLCTVPSTECGTLDPGLGIPDSSARRRGVIDLLPKTTKMCLSYLDVALLLDILHCSEYDYSQLLAQGCSFPTIVYILSVS